VRRSAAPLGDQAHDLLDGEAHIGSLNFRRSGSRAASSAELILRDKVSHDLPACGR
jgi:hypothetical protein